MHCYGWHKNRMNSVAGNIILVYHSANGLLNFN